MEWLRQIVWGIKSATEDRHHSRDLERDAAERRQDAQGIGRAIAGISSAVQVQGEEHRKESATDNRKNRRVAIVAVGMAAAYAAVAAFQLLEMRRSVDLGERILDMTERAWVLPKIEGPVLNSEGGSLIKVLLRNTGKSPAFVEFAAASSLEPTAPEVKSYEGGIRIAGGEAENPNLPHIIRLPDPTKLELPNVMGGAKTLYVWVFVRYKDPIKDGRFTQSCSVYTRYGRTVPCASQHQVFR